MSQDENNLQTSPITQTAEEPAKMGPFQRLTGAIFSPGETFEDVNRKPTWLVAMIIGIIFASASSLFFEWRVKPDWDRVIRDSIRERVEARGQQMPPADVVDQQVQWGKTFAKIAPVFPIIIVPLFSLALSGIFALGLMLMQARATFKKILSVVSWSGAGVGLVQTIVFVATLMVRDTEGINPTQPSSFTATNLAALLPSGTGHILRALAAQFDVFTIWWLIVLSIGFAAIGGKKVTTGKTGTLVFALFAIWIVIRVAWAAITGS